MSRARILRIGLRALAIAALLFSAFTVRVVLSARSELAIGDRDRDDGDAEAAVLHYRRAARWYAPFSPYHERALVELARIAAGAEMDGDVELALAAHRAVRSAILGARSFYVPERARLDAANRRIAALMAGQPAPPIDAGKSRAQLEREHLQLLQHDPDPKLGWTLVLLFGFFSWVFGAFAFTQRAIDDDDRFVPREALRWGAVIGVGFALFVLGMTLA